MHDGVGVGWGGGQGCSACFLCLIVLDDVLTVVSSLYTKLWGAVLFVFLS